MTEQDVIEDLDALSGADPELAHSMADTIILEFLKETNPKIEEAYFRVVERCGWWACA